MPVDVPWDAGPLWTDIQPRFEWPPTNEDRVVELGIGWTNAGASFLHAGSSTSLEKYLPDGWQTPAGEKYVDKVRALRGTTGTTGEDMKHVAWLATEFAADLTHTKESIARLIRDNAFLYTHMNNFFGWPDNEGRRRLVDRLVALINAFLDVMADRIAARGTAGPEKERPRFPEGRLTDERWAQLAESIPPGGDRPVPPGRQERLNEFYNRLRDSPPARNAEEALDQVRRTLDQVEDDLSGIPKQVPPPPPNMPDGRMYPPLDDFVVRNADGTIAARTRAHSIDLGADGSIRITNLRTGQVEFSKP